MIFKPYTEYKDSDIPWLGKVPKKWEVKRLGSVFFERKEKVSDYDYPPLSVTKNGIFPQLENAAKSQDSDNRKKVVKGDFVINSRSDRKGSSGLSKLTGSVSLINTVLIPSSIEKKYCHKLLKSHYFKEEFYRVGKGIVADLWSTKYSEMSTIMIPLPPIPEQIQIVRFLDWKTSQIAKFIKSKKRMIELLKEQKQVIINDVVTGKIDVTTGKLYPKYKDSGIEWLGKVPEGWKIIPIKRIALFNPSKSETGLNNQSIEKVVFLPMEKVSIDGKIDCSEKKKYKEVCTGFSYFRKNDVVVAKITPCFENGKGAFLNDLETEYGFGTTEFITIRPYLKINGKYLRLILSSKWFLKISEKYMTGSAGQKRISSNFIKNFLIMLPSINIQESIISYIKKIEDYIDIAISRIECEIFLIQEYRDCLIADVVTGKVDVREIKVPEFEEVIEEANGKEEIDENIDEEEENGEE